MMPAIEYQNDFMWDLLAFWEEERVQRGEGTTIRPCHKTIADALTQMMLGQLPTPNLMLLQPPRIGKTDLGIKAFEAFALSHFPDSEFINGSNGTELATENTKAVRDILSAAWYRDIIDDDWGAVVARRGDQASGRADYFHTTAGGSVKGVGMGQTVIGFGAGKLRQEFGGAIMIDDALKPLDATSPTVRKTCIDWFHGSLEPRRNRKDDPMTPICLIMQRLHPQDLAGHLLSTERHRWTVVQIPAIDEAGESIWPARISLAELKHMEEVNPDTYHSQFMQQPSDFAYRIIHDEWWKYWNDRAAVERRITLKIIVADTAFKTEDANDFSVLQCWGFEGATAAYLIDQDRGKWEFPELLAHARDFLKKHSAPRLGVTPATEAWIEDKASGTSLVQTLKREGLPFREWLPIHAQVRVIDKDMRLAAPGRDKVARVNQCTSPICTGRVRLPYPLMPGHKWVEGFILESGAFTKDDSHLHDDQVDAMTMALLIWQQRGGGSGPLPVWKEKELVWPPNQQGA